MSCAVIINLDYEHHPTDICRRIWDELDRRMPLAGFSRHKRLFLTTLDWTAASNQAKAVVDQIEKELAIENIVVFDIVREFYCFQYAQLNDLLDPINQETEVSFIDTGTFNAFGGTKL